MTNLRKGTTSPDGLALLVKSSMQLCPQIGRQIERDPIKHLQELALPCSGRRELPVTAVATVRRQAIQIQVHKWDVPGEHTRLWSSDDS